MKYEKISKKSIFNMEGLQYLRPFHNNWIEFANRKQTAFIADNFHNKSIEMIAIESS